MLRFYFNRRIIAGCLLALAILSWLAYQSYRNKRKVITGSEWVAHTQEVLYNTEQLLSLAASVELGQRGFTITGNEAFLVTYRNSRDEIPEHIENLKKLTRDNHNQQIRLSRLDTLIAKLLRFSEQTVEARKINFEGARALNATMTGRATLEAIRAIVYEIQNEESFLLKNRTQENQSRIGEFNNAFVYLLVATTLILIAVFYAMNVSLRSRHKTEERLHTALNEIRDLYDNAPCGYHSLDASGTFVDANNTICRWLGYSKEDLIGKFKFSDIIVEEELPKFRESFEKFKSAGAVYDLEFNFKKKDGSTFPVILSAEAITDANNSYVKSRSVTIDNTERKRAEMQIKNLNHELEAFTYSVSHDLRAPLRSIDGYSKILQEDYYDRFDDEGKRVLQVVMNNARRMGKLIDDLLDFARLGRKELIRTEVNMDSLVRGIANDLVTDERDRKIDIHIGELHPAPVDVDMIRQVWINLISNAIKYSGKKPDSKIVIRSEARGNEIVYSVSDNGVGFDMQYVSKLFGVFQRLHKLTDFSGTGVGLAIVKRIVDRHQGRVWAEGKVNNGATFYFTIPNK